MAAINGIDRYDNYMRLHHNRYKRSKISDIKPHYTWIAVSNYFNDPVDGLIPEGIQCIEFGLEFNQPLDKLPSSLLQLSIDCWHYDHPLNNLPLGLINLSIQGHLRNSFDKSPHIDDLFIANYNYRLDDLPYTLLHFELACEDCGYEYPLNNLPDGAKAP